MTIMHFEKLEKKGWVEFENISTEGDLIEIANKFGKIVNHPNGELIGLLKPNDGEKVIKGTFSNIYGFNSFPLHTDTAFWIKPARYLLLNSIYSSSCSTFFISTETILNHFSNTELGQCRGAIFKVKTIHEQYYSSIFFNHNSITGLKYDPSCMFPANSKAKAFVNKFEQIISDIPLEKVKWTGNNAVIIDNWKMLHGRDTALKSEKRELRRIYII
jgi:alpha-ketoglutarate-dependent taurine dioxygenase